MIEQIHVNVFVKLWALTNDNTESSNHQQEGTDKSGYP